MYPLAGVDFVVKSLAIDRAEDLSRGEGVEYKCRHDLISLNCAVEAEDLVVRVVEDKDGIVDSRPT